MYINTLTISTKGQIVLPKKARGLPKSNLISIEVKEIFDQAKTGRITVIIEQTVFTEVIFFLSSFYKVLKNKITQILSELLA